MGKIFDGFKIGFGIFLFFTLIFGIVFAIGFHTADEILGGTFVGNYVFQGNLDLRNTNTNFTGANVSGLSSSSGIVDETVTVCDSTKEGIIRYAYGVVEVCNGDSWELLGGSNNQKMKLLLHFDGNIDDSSTIGNSLTATGNSHTTSVGKYGYSATFDGDGDYINVPYSTDWTFDGDFTIDYWVKTTKATDGVYDAMFGTKSYMSAGCIVLFQSSSNVVRVYINGNNVAITGTTLINDGAWHHIALVRNSGVIKLYVDGNQEGSSYSYSNSLAGSFVRIGHDGYTGSGTYFTGSIDEFRIIKGEAVWNSNFAVPTGPYS